jgi:serine/threonine protein kinase
MKPSQWAMIREMFAEARKLPIEDREEFLTSSCNHDSVLKQVRALLANDQEDDFLEKPALGGTFTLADSAEPEKGMQLPTNLIEGYTLTKILGSGASGIVYEAKQAEPNRMVAIKVLRAGAMGEQDRLRFQRESETLANLEHQNIATVHAVGTTKDGSPWMALELISGLRLDDWAEEKSIASIVSMLEKISDALAAAHKKNIVHRDVKPANILVTHNDQPRVLDFGIAHITKGESEESSLVTQTGAVLGTQKYMSPEQASGSPNLDARSDVYSLGIVLQELLREDSPRDLKTIAKKATDELATRRYSDAGEFRDDLARWLSQEPIVARRATPWYVTSLWVRRHRLVSTFSLFLVVSFIVMYSVTSDKERAEYASFIQQAQLAYEQGDMNLMAIALANCNPASRNWEWHWLEQLSTTGELPILADDLSASNSGEVLACKKEGALYDALTGNILCDAGKSCVKTLLSQNGGVWITLDEDGTMYVHSTSSPCQLEQIVSLGIPVSHISGIALSSNGHFAVVASVTPFDPADLTTLDAKTVIRGINLQNSVAFFSDTLSSRMLDSDEALAISENGESIVVAHVNGSVTTWRLGKQTDKREFKVGNNPNTVAMSQDGTFFALAKLGSGVSNVTLLHMDTLLPVEDTPTIAHDRGIVSVAIAPDNKTIASVDGGGILRITPLYGKAPIVEPAQGRGQSARIQFSENGNQLLICHGNGHARMREITDNTTEVKHWSSPIVEAWITPTTVVTTHVTGTTKSFDLQTEQAHPFTGSTVELATQSTTADGERTASIAEQVGTIQIQDTQSEQTLLSFTWPGARIVAVGFADEGNSLIAISVDGRIKRWSIK